MKALGYPGRSWYLRGGNYQPEEVLAFAHHKKLK